MKVQAKCWSKGADGADFRGEDFIDIGVAVEKIVEAGFDGNADKQIVAKLFEQGDCGGGEDAIAHTAETDDRDPASLG
jgi:hypothetical protein